MATKLIIGDWWFRTAPDDALITKLLGVVDAAKDGDARKALAKTTDAIAARAVAVASHARWERKRAKIEELVGDKLEPYRAAHPQIAEAVLHEAWRLTKSVNPKPSEVGTQADAALKNVEAVLWAVEAAEQAEAFRQHKQELGADYGDDFPAVPSAAPVPQGEGHNGDSVPDPAPGPAPGQSASGTVTQYGGMTGGSGSDPDPDPDGLPFQAPDPCGVFSSARLQQFALAAYAEPFEQYGLSRATFKLAQLHREGKVDLGADVSLQLFNLMRRLDRRVPDVDDRRAIFARVLGPESEFPELVEHLYDASVQFLRAQSQFHVGGALATNATQAFDVRADDLHCYVSTKCCGIVSLITPGEIEDAGAMLQIFAGEGTACALGLGECEATTYRAIAALTPEIEDRPSARATRDLAVHGRELILSLDPLPDSDLRRRETAEHAIAYHNAWYGQPQLGEDEMRQLPAPVGETPVKSNGSSAIQLVALQR
jgi:hypothetical protein